jgi:hypothetical protein
MFQSLIPDGAGVIQGIVTQVGPLVITALNDAKLILPETILIIPFHLQDYKTQIDIQWNATYGAATIDSKTRKDGTHPHGSSGEHGGHTGGNGSHSHLDSEGAHVNHLETFNILGATMTVYNSLKIGEKVHLLSFNHGKKYYVLDRVGNERQV